MRGAFFDLDGTLTTTPVWEGIMAHFRERGLKRWTHRAFWAYHMPIYLFRRLGLISESAFRLHWAAHLAWYVRGDTLDQAGQVWDWVATDFLSQYWRQDVREKLDEHRQAGDLVVLVSGSPVPLLQRIAAELDVQHVVGTRFALRDGHYSGRSLQPVCIDENKATLTKSYLSGLRDKVDYPASFAYADSISDLQMLEMVGQPVAVYPDEALRREALKRNWSIFP
jgi:HAD superfamily hydrolase (TIGR01490 family)